MNKDNTSYCATAESVTLFWDKPEYAAGTTHYQVLLNGRLAGNSNRTHFTVIGLIPCTEYRAEIQTGGTVLGGCVVGTGPCLQRLNVRDFGALGNGETMDTAALQRVIDACGPDQEVYLPAGIRRRPCVR